MIPVVELLRIEENFDYGTFGFLRIQKRIFCATLEPPDLENQPDVSSIPAQQYMVWRVVSPKYDECFEVQNVPGRDNILFHAGNFKRHTEGCILLGQHHGKLGRNRAVLNSGNTYKKFMSQMHGHDAFHLTITEHY